MICEGLFPSNKQQGYVLRRLIRRAVVKMHQLGGAGNKSELGTRVFHAVGKIYDETYFDAQSAEFVEKSHILSEEIVRFEKVLKVGLVELKKHEHITGTVAFDLLQSYGFPWELTYELALEKGQQVDREEFQKEFKKHQDLSRSAASGMFKGGLADHSEATTKLHTAHHLLLASLQKLIDPTIKQRGSNITAERLRIDLSFSRKFTPEELKAVEDLVNKTIEQNLTVTRVEMPKDVAEKIGAQMEFGAKYPDVVSIYFVEDEEGNAISKEFCGGPHVENTSELAANPDGAPKHFKIQKEEASSAGVRRIKAVLE